MITTEETMGEGRRCWPRLRSHLALVGLGLLAVSAPAAGQEHAALYLAVDKTYVLGQNEPFSKVSVANPAIADVQVLTPMQLLITGKALGSTSLLLFSSNSTLRHYTVVVHPSPLLPIATDAAAPAPHSVLVHRGDRVSERLFLRDRNDLWIELGALKADQEATKK
jgi:hypothetical protein